MSGAANQATAGVPEFKDVLGHPRPLWMLFMTEFWERFAFYGMRWALTLYIVAQFFGGDASGEGYASRTYGAFLALVLSGHGSWNIYSQIGIVTLVGLIAKHGILIVEFANQLQEQGKSKFDAVLDATALRLRPILMTTGAMVLGSVPLAIASGAGAEARNQIGLVIVGGMAIGTFFTLFVVPVVYLLIARNHQKALAAAG